MGDRRLEGSFPSQDGTRKGTRLERRDLYHEEPVLSSKQVTAFAHELNESLTAILNNAEAAGLILSDANPDLAETRAALEDIVSDVQRAADSIRRIVNMLLKEQRYDRRDRS